MSQIIAILNQKGGVAIRIPPLITDPPHNSSLTSPPRNLTDRVYNVGWNECHSYLETHL